MCCILQFAESVSTRIARMLFSTLIFSARRNAVLLTLFPRAAFEKAIPLLTQMCLGGVNDRHSRFKLVYLYCP